MPGVTARQRAAELWSPEARATRIELCDWWAECARLNHIPLAPADIVLLPVRAIERVVLDTAPCGTVPFLLD